MFRFSSPTTAIICGPSRSGKTSFVFNVLDKVDKMFQEPVQKTYYFYSVWQDMFERNQYKDIAFIQGLPDPKKISEISDTGHKLLIIDDLQMTALNDVFIANLFSRESHHRNLTV